MTLTLRLRLPLVLLVVSSGLFGCVAHEKNGDRSAALGEWRDAYSSYREALSRDPESVEMKKKYENAKREATADAQRRAQGCFSRANWRCAINEIDFAISLDPASVEFSDFRRAATRSLALWLVEEARTDVTQRRYAEALNSIGDAISTAPLPEVLSGASEVRRLVGEQALAEAEGLRGARQFVQALSLLDLAVRAAPEHAAFRETVRAEYEAFRTAEYERLTAEGDTELSQLRWLDAGSKYRAALAARPGGRAENLAQFAEGMWQGEQGIGQRSFERAASGFRKAMASGLDRDHLARRGLDSVEVRTYRIRIRELMVSPAMPDGRQWVGPRNALLDRLVKSAVTAAGHYFVPGVGGKIAGAVVGEMQSLAPENVPFVHIEVISPVGPRLSTIPDKKLYVVLDAEFVVTGNHFDQRTMSFKVIGEGDSVQDVGVFDLQLGDVIRSGGFAGTSQSVLGMRLIVEPAPELGAGYFAAMRPIADPSNAVAAFSEPRPGCVVFRLTKVAGAIAHGDYDNEFGLDGAPDFALQIEQGGRIVFQSHTAQDQASAEWNLENTFLYVIPGEKLVVRTWDIDLQDHDSALYMEFPVEAFKRGEVVLRTPRGSWASLTVTRAQ